jgi:hypothetical protein
MEKFITVDGELVDGEYRILGSSEGTSCVLPSRIRSSTAFSYLLSLAAQGAKLYGYGIGFDVSHWIADLTDKQKARLASEGRCLTQQGTAFYRVSYRPNTFFKVDLLDGMPKPGFVPKSIGSALVCDLMKWHRKSFVEVSYEWDLGDQGGRELVCAGKSGRGKFTGAFLGAVERYNARECELLAELAEEMEHSLKQVGIPISFPLTVGGVAGRLAQKHGTDSLRKQQPEEIKPLLSKAFHGGRMQVTRFGRFRDVRHYDIRSAYGWAMAQLPDMLGTWEHMGGELPGQWSICHVTWNSEDGATPVMPFPLRDEKGYIHYPPKGHGWYWSPIVRGAYHSFPEVDIRITDWWNYTPADPASRPFWYMRDLYEMRQSLARDSDPMAGMLKLLIVATWGRMCGPGGRRKDNSAGMLDWAGMTTALIHERILEIAYLDPKAFISCCVDGLFTESRIALNPFPGDNLGDWSCEHINDLFLLRPACYWAQRDNVWEAKTSGILADSLPISDVLSEWNGNGYRGKLKASQRICRGLLQCHREGDDYSRLGQFEEIQSILHLNPGIGRYGHVCPTYTSGTSEWERWLPYWPPVASVNNESQDFHSRADRRIPEEAAGKAIEEVTDF